ncbi:class I SAM-dependent methyltransferase [Cellulomonas telluris]|uniref:class I SAM-dependent methyltransferase n=1 Tax=Cellulomonas telluris TaxID=2306636 RepID=UPI0010A8BF48|nr:class I SAM-dependent methyltransferase [Cellulomonas telluris]
MIHAQAQLDDAIRAYYDTSDEGSRLTRSVGGQIELTRVRRLVGARLAPGSRVLDVGGATGVHARWLAAAGHEVTLVDPVPSQVAVAARAGTFGAVVGDARDLPAPDASVDAVLLLGPLYHLVTRDDRMGALAEARRVLRPGGIVFAQAIGRLTAFTDAATVRGFPTLDQDDMRVLRTGEWTNPGPGFPGGHFHTAAELRAEVEEAGFADVLLHGLEGPNVGMLELVADDEALVRSGTELVERLEARVGADRRDLLAEASPHILAVGTR